MLELPTMCFGTYSQRNPKRWLSNLTFGFMLDHESGLITIVIEGNPQREAYLHIILLLLQFR